MSIKQKVGNIYILTRYVSSDTGYVNPWGKYKRHAPYAAQIRKHIKRW